MLTHNFQDIRSQGNQGQASSYSSIVHLYIGSPINKDIVKQVNLEAIL